MTNTTRAGPITTRRVRPNPPVDGIPKGTWPARLAAAGCHPIAVERALKLSCDEDGRPDWTRLHPDPDSPGAVIVR